MPDYAGMTLGPYKLEMLLGKGGMASVYRAYQTSVKRYVAIKVMAPEIADTPGFVERFEREAEVIASLEHPHILPVIDYGNANGVHYIVMRYVEGGSLEDRMVRKPLSLLDSAKFLNQMSQALDYAHKRGVIHRDLKPNNVLLDSGENAYLTDFGIARLAQSDSKLTATGSVMGTPAYMSPEQAMGRTVDARSDIYTLGVVLYEMVLNELPFSADTPAAYIFQHVYEKPKAPKLIKPELPDSIAAVINRALAKNPDDRFQSAGDVSDAFADAMTGKTPLPTPLPSPDVENTLVGGPLEVTPSSGSYAGTKGPGGTGGIVPPTPPSQPPTAAASATPGGAPQTFPYTAPVTSAAATPAPPPVARRFPAGLLIGLVVVLLALVGGLGFFLFTNNNNANATGTAQAVSANTGTAVAVLVLSSTHTPTDTPTATATASLTSTPVNTATNTATETPNATLTAGAQAMAMVLTLQANQTATANAQFTAAAAAQTATAAVVATQTQQSIDQATQTAGKQLTATAIAGSVTATRTRAPTSTRTPTPTKGPSTATPVPVNLAATATAVIGSLIQNGQLNLTSDSVMMTRSFLNLDAPNSGNYYWNNITDQPVADFVMSADVTWNAPDVADECGLLFRYDEPAANPDQRVFYAVTITRQGNYRVTARDNDGYRSSFVVDQPSSLIHTDDGATNSLTLAAVGSDFQLYINGELAGSFQDSALAQGSVGIFASPGPDKAGLTCNFKNLWAYALQGGYFTAATPTKGAAETETPAAASDGLMSDNPNDVLATLIQMGIVTGTPKLVAQDPSNEMVVALDEKSTSRFSNALNTTNYTNFVVTTDIVSNGDEKAKDIQCGMYYDGANVPDNLVAAYYDRDKNFALSVRKNTKWGQEAVTYGQSDAIKPGVGVSNRFTLVVIGDETHLYVNGAEVFDVTDSTFTSGQVGYYIEKGKTGGKETCDYSNTTLWRLN